MISNEYYCCKYCRNYNVSTGLCTKQNLNKEPVDSCADYFPNGIKCKYCCNYCVDGVLNDTKAMWSLDKDGKCQLWQGTGYGVDTPKPKDDYCSHFAQIASDGMVRMLGHDVRTDGSLIVTFSDVPNLKEKVEQKENSKSKSGCYIATAVYGTYDCPQVWVLRRYRDYALAKTWYGRTFVNTYYAISPFLVKHFGNTRWFKRFWNILLGKIVKRLNKQGFEDTPYIDCEWKK